MDSEVAAQEALTKLHADMRACHRCRQEGHAITPGAVFSGSVSARIMIVGQAPGSTECETGRPFNGSSGKRLFDWLAQAGWDEASFRTCHYMTAITRCYPGRSSNGKGDRVPTRAEQKLCAPFLERELALVQPEIVVPVGSIAVRRFLGSVRLSDVVGTVVNGEGDLVTVPLPHPSGANLWLNRRENQCRVLQALKRLSLLRESLGL